jgi:predicted DNA-binding transcriptional regulator YafY
MEDKTLPYPRRSTWAVFDRCLALLLRLMRSETTSWEMLDIVEQKAIAGEEALSRSALQRRLEEDRSRLREWFGCEWEYDRRTGTYTLTSIERPLLDLTPQALRGLAFLQATFSGNAAPMSVELRALIDHLLMVLPEGRRHELRQERGLLEVNLQSHDSDNISDEVWDAVQRACSEHRQLEFEYFSPQQMDRRPRTHRVEPLRHFFDPVHGHFYLEAYWIESYGPSGRRLQEKMQHFRLGRIQNPHILPTHFRPRSRPIRKYELVYKLAPEVARLGVTQHFPGSVITQHSDGGATVHAQSTDLFFDLRALLFYGANCRVIGGKEAVKEMREIVKRMYQSYHTKS